MATPDTARQKLPFRRPKSAVGPLGVGALLVLVGLLPRYLAIPLFELGLVLSLALPLGIVVIVVALRRVALGLEAVYDQLEAVRRG